LVVVGAAQPVSKACACLVSVAYGLNGVVLDTKEIVLYCVITTMMQEAAWALQDERVRRAVDRQEAERTAQSKAVSAQWHDDIAKQRAYKAHQVLLILKPSVLLSLL
jgi:hypothetical protein